MDNLCFHDDTIERISKKNKRSVYQWNEIERVHFLAGGFGAPFVITIHGERYRIKRSNEQYEKCYLFMLRHGIVIENIENIGCISIAVTKDELRYYSRYIAHNLDLLIQKKKQDIIKQGYEVETGFLETGHIEQGKHFNLSLSDKEAESQNYILEYVVALIQVEGEKKQYVIDGETKEPIFTVYPIAWYEEVKNEKVLKLTFFESNKHNEHCFNWLLHRMKQAKKKEVIDEFPFQIKDCID